MTALPVHRRGHMTARFYDAFEAEQDQVKLAETGQAKNQCPECLSYRIDGEPPFLHVRGCTQPRRY